MLRHSLFIGLMVATSALSDIVPLRTGTLGGVRLHSNHPELHRLCDLPLSIVGTGEADRYEITVHSTFQLSPAQQKEAAQNPDLFDGVKPDPNGLIYGIQNFSPTKHAGEYQKRFETYDPNSDAAKAIEGDVRFTTSIYAERGIIPAAEIDKRTKNELELYSPLRRENMSFTDRFTGQRKGVARIFHGSPSIQLNEQTMELPQEENSYLLPLERSNPNFKLPGRYIKNPDGSLSKNTKLYALEWGLLGGSGEVDQIATVTSNQTARLLKERYCKNGTYPNDPVMYAEVTDGGVNGMVGIGWKILARPEDLNPNAPKDASKDPQKTRRYILEYKVSDYVRDHGGRTKFPVPRNKP